MEFVDVGTHSFLNIRAQRTVRNKAEQLLARNNLTSQGNKGHVPGG